ncbi:carboxymuconolactone decarboxylase family protein [Ramlibacter sp.]|uniref:carboxymuconolactone decarboxylase family protein n=1 Tax=Ramlibacter sp. TaxID=1917967 RepID=UPI003D1470C3
MDKQLFETGLATRKEVLGPDYVHRAFEQNVLTDEFQQIVTEFAWGAVWSRPDFPRKTRSMLNLAMLTALGREHELRLHMRAAIRNGVTKEDFVNIMLQAMIYCGVPAANDSLRLAKEVWREYEAESKGS